MESSCPYSAERQEQEQISNLNNMPMPSQEPHPSHSSPLSTDREESSIPMSGKYDGKVWIYPSEQMFYNAMKRKSWNPNEKDMSVVVPIHNAVNEQAWKHILEWESIHKSDCSQPKLLKFEGKPKEISVKARFWNLFGYSLPFDRHDWVSTFIFRFIYYSSMWIDVVIQ